MPPSASSGAHPADLSALLGRWRDDLAAWAIPEHIARAAAESPWVLPWQVFARRADRLSAEPGGPSFEHAWAALDPPGSVLDIGSGPRAACLPLVSRATRPTPLGPHAAMPETLAGRAPGPRLQGPFAPRPAPGLPAP